MQIGPASLMDLHVVPPHAIRYVYTSQSLCYCSSPTNLEFDLTLCQNNPIFLSYALTSGFILFVRVSKAGRADVHSVCMT